MADYCFGATGQDGKGHRGADSDPHPVRKKTLAEEIAALDVSSFQCPPLPMKPDRGAPELPLRGYDVITLEKLLERQYAMPEPQTAGEVIGYYAKWIAQEMMLPSQFAVLAPRYGSSWPPRPSAGGRAERERDDPRHLQQRRQLRDRGSLRQGTPEAGGGEQEPRLVTSRKVSDIPPYPYSRPNFFAASKTVFNWAACDNDYEERRFSRMPRMWPPLPSSRPSSGSPYRQRGQPPVLRARFRGGPG